MMLHRVISGNQFFSGPMKNLTEEYFIRHSTEVYDRKRRKEGGFSRGVVKQQRLSGILSTILNARLRVF